MWGKRREGSAQAAGRLATWVFGAWGLGVWGFGMCGLGAWAPAAHAAAVAYAAADAASDASAEQPGAVPGVKLPRLAVVGKTINYRQSADGHLRRINYHFFAEVFLSPGEQGGSAYLTEPDGRTISFQSLGDLLSISGTTNYPSLAALNAEIPDGTFHLHFEAPDMRAIDGTLELHVTPALLAEPPRITLEQDGRVVAPGAVDAKKALTIRWSPFRQGHSDPNGILDDMIFVHVGDCRGRVIARTPAPFAGSPALTYRATSYVIPANTLAAGEVWQVSVEHAPVVTKRLQGMPALVTYPATTFLDFETTGVSAHACPNPPYRMDNGQSDRQGAPAEGATHFTQASGMGPNPDVRFFVVVKSSNYAQDAGGGLKLLNYHFFSEIFPAPGVTVTGELGSSSMPRAKPYGPHDQTLYFEGGHFTTLAAVDAAWPNGTYGVSLRTPHVEVKRAALELAGPNGRTDLPVPVHITLEQGGHAVAPTSLVASEPAVVRWTHFSNGRADPHGIVDDMIFVVIQDCLGKRIFHTGLPFEGPYLRFDSNHVDLPANLLAPGQPYSMFVEMPHVVDSTRAAGVAGFASYATATYLDLRTSGVSSRACPAKPPAMDTGETDRPSSVADITGQVTFLYYHDLVAPRRFYGEVLGLPSYFNQAWVSLFRTASGATVGLVKTEQAPTTPAVKGAVVMVSLVTDDVKGWYDKLRRDPRVRIMKPLYDHPQVPIRAFEVRDPGGYTVEIFQWLKH